MTDEPEATTPATPPSQGTAIPPGASISTDGVSRTVSMGGVTTIERQLSMKEMMELTRSQSSHQLSIARLEGAQAQLGVAQRDHASATQHNQLVAAKYGIPDDAQVTVSDEGMLKIVVRNPPVEPPVAPVKKKGKGKPGSGKAPNPTPTPAPQPTPINRSQRRQHGDRNPVTPVVPTIPGTDDDVDAPPAPILDPTP